MNADNVPIILKWVPKMSLIKWAFEGACITELTDLEFDNEGNPSDIISGMHIGAQSLAYFLWAFKWNVVSDLYDADLPCR